MVHYPDGDRESQDETCRRMWEDCYSEVHMFISHYSKFKLTSVGYLIEIQAIGNLWLMSCSSVLERDKTWK